MPDDRDAIELLGTVARLDVEHEIDHFLLFTTKRAAERARIVLSARDYAVRDLLRLFGRCCMIVHTRLIPEESAILALREIFTEIAEEQKAEDRRNGGK